MCRLSFWLKVNTGSTSVHRALPPSEEEEETANLRAMAGNGGMQNVTTIISSIITTIKLKS